MEEVKVASEDGSPLLSVRLQKMSNNLKQLYYSTPSDIGTLRLEGSEPKTSTATFEEKESSPSKSPVVASTTCYPKTEKSLAQDYLRFINSATKEELKRLKGIGEKRAAYIISLREESPEPFKQIDDLKTIGLSAKQIKKMLGN